MKTRSIICLLFGFTLSLSSCDYPVYPVGGVAWAQVITAHFLVGITRPTTSTTTATTMAGVMNPAGSITMVTLTQAATIIEASTSTAASITATTTINRSFDAVSVGVSSHGLF